MKEDNKNTKFFSIWVYKVSKEKEKKTKIEEKINK